VLDAFVKEGLIPVISLSQVLNSSIIVLDGLLNLIKTGSHKSTVIVERSSGVLVDSYG